MLLLLSRFSHVWLCNPIDGSPPGSPVPGILQAKTLECVAVSFSNAWTWKVKVKLLSRVRLSDPMDCSLPGSSIHGIFQARVPEWVAISFSRGSSQPRIEPGSPALRSDALSSEPPGNQINTRAENKTKKQFFFSSHLWRAFMCRTQLNVLYMLSH